LACAVLGPCACGGDGGAVARPGASIPGARRQSCPRRRPAERLNPYAECLPTAVAAQADARWGELFALFVQHSDKVKSVTLWGVSDGHSWLNNWPVNGRTNYALLFDRELRPKTAWQAVSDAAGTGP
jgi:hypothetical protein